MNEIIITVVELESHGPNATFVSTRVVRVEFDTQEGLQRWLEHGTDSDTQRDYGIANVEQLTAKG